MSKTALLLPCYNEEKSIKKVITDFQSVIPYADIYVCDNNSTDISVSIAQSCGATVLHEHAQGKGNVIRRMFSEIDADIYLLVDADDTYSATNAPELISAIENGYDMAVGDRLSTSYFTENKRPFHNAGNIFLRNCVNKVFKGNIADLLTGYRAFSKRFVKSFPATSTGFEIETEMSIYALCNNMKYINIPVGYKDREKDNPSKLRTIPDGLRCFRTVLKKACEMVWKKNNNAYRNSTPR